MSFDFYMHEWTEEDAGAFRDCYARIKLLAKDNNDRAKAKYRELVYGKFKVKKGELPIYPVYEKGVINNGLWFLVNLSIWTPDIDISIQPSFSFFLQFPFKLATPYLSKDDEEFYICENPVRKDRVFKVPMVSASTWKGNMRWTAGKELEYETDPDKQFKMRMQITKLFGHENEAEKRYFDSLMPDRRDDFTSEIKRWSNKSGLRRGRLNFYSTFFNQIGLEVINPHDRKTKAGIQPIYIESVPENAQGVFSLLYVPFDLLGKPVNEIKTEVAEDLGLICKALKEMMLTYGFSAKKGDGFGIIKDDFNIPGYPEPSLSIRLADVETCKFNNFTELTKVFNEIINVLGDKDKCPEISEKTGR